MTYREMAMDAGCTSEDEINQMAQMIEEDHWQSQFDDEEDERQVEFVSDKYQETPLNVRK